jgi:hemerythrin superfamily protein
MAEGTSVVDLLLRDHHKVEELLGRLDSTSDNALHPYFDELREELVRHEVAEELIVYPAFRKHVDGGDDIADARIAEQAQAEKMLSQMEKQEDDPVVLRGQLAEFRTMVLLHAKHEESDVFPALESDVPQAELTELGNRYEKALSAAPTHPHPNAPDTPPGNMALGPVAALIDRVRDAMRAA